MSGPTANSRTSPHVLQVSMSDAGGGAERIALDLHAELGRQGYPASIALCRSTAEHDRCVVIPNDAYRNPIVRMLVGRLPSAATPGGLRARQIGRSILEPGRALRRALGHDDFSYPATSHLPELVTPSADILHLHNLHAGYFDLRALPSLSRERPVVITLHDAWLMSGHCAYSLDCERWQTGCGACPYPDVPPAMLRDGSAYNWQVKRRIFAESRLHVVGCSDWILKRAQRSMLSPAIQTASLVPNGVDQSVFRPGDKAAARARLGIAEDARVIMFSANGLDNPYKDFATLIAAVPAIADRLADRPLLLLAVGAKRALPGLDERLIRIVPHLDDRMAMASHLHSADLFVHATRADNHPLGVLEAQSCGVPSVVTGVGGTPETIADGITGLTCPLGDARALGEAVAGLLGDDARLRAFGQAAATYAAGRFSLERMTADYRELYERVKESHA